MRHLLVTISLLFLAQGCSHNIKISPTLTPTAVAGDKLALATAVYFAPDVRTYSESAKPSSFSGSAHTYNVEIGPSMCACLLKSVSTVYDSVVEAEVPPTSGKYERVIKFTMQNSALDVYFQEGFLSSNAKSNYSLSLAMEAYDGSDMSLIRKTAISGSGFGSKGTDAFGANKTFASTVEAGVQQVCDGVANMLISGFAEPKSRASEGLADSMPTTTPRADRASDPNTKEQLASELRKLKELFDQGLLTQDEYDGERQEVLEKY